MHVIFHPVHDDGFAASFIYQVSNNSLHFASPRFIKHRCPVFYCEDSLKVDLVVAIRHSI
jgi:hypothetical protein